MIQAAPPLKNNNSSMSIASDNSLRGGHIPPSLNLRPSAMSIESFASARTNSRESYASARTNSYESYASARTNSRESCARLGTGSFEDFMGKLDNLIDDNSPTLASIYDGATLNNESNTSDFQSSSGNSTVTTTTTMDRFFDDATLKNASGNTTVTTTTTTTTTAEKSSDVPVLTRQISNMSVQDDDDENSKTG